MDDPSKTWVGGGSAGLLGDGSCDMDGTTAEKGVLGCGVEAGGWGAGVEVDLPTVARTKFRARMAPPTAGKKAKKYYKIETSSL